MDIHITTTLINNIDSQEKSLSRIVILLKQTYLAYGGQSGSSVFLEDNDQLVGILVKGGDDDKNAILEPITKDIARWYKGKKDILENPVQ